MVLVSLVYIIFAPQIIMLISGFKSDPEVVAYGSLCLRVIAAGYIFYAYGMVVTQAFNGAGDTRTPTIINFFCFWLFQLPFAYFVALVWEVGPKGVFLAITLAEVGIAIASIWVFKKGKWKTVKV